MKDLMTTATPFPRKNWPSTAASQETYERPALVGFVPLHLQNALFGYAEFLEFFDTTFRGADRQVIITPNLAFPGRRIEKAAPAKAGAALRNWRTFRKRLPVSADQLSHRLTLRHQLDRPAVLRAVPGVQRDAQRVIDRRGQV